MRLSSIRRSPIAPDDSIPPHRRFNEPYLAEQANLSPSAAATLWKAQMEPLKESAKLVSPAVSNGVETTAGAPIGVPWLVEFLAACDGCQIDAVAVRSVLCARREADFVHAASLV